MQLFDGRKGHLKEQDAAVTYRIWKPWQTRSYCSLPPEYLWEVQATKKSLKEMQAESNIPTELV